MKNVKLIHFSDLHLDAPFTSLGAGEKSRIRRQELKACLRGIVAAAAEEKAELLLISGDLYEHEYADKKTICFISDEFRSIPETKIVIIPGNHDPYTGNSFYKNFDWPENVHILSQNKNHVLFEELNTCVMTQDYVTELKANNRNAAAFKIDYFNILVLHGTLDMSFSKNAWNPLESSVLDKLEMDYIALGHFHSIIQGAGARGNIFNPGSPEPLGFDEEGSHGIFVVTLSETDSGERKRKAEFRAIARRSYIKLEIDIEGCRTDEEITSKIQARMYAAGSPEDLYEIRLTGYRDVELKPDTAYIAEYISNEVFFARVIDNSVPWYDFNAIALEPGLRGLFTRKLLDRMKAAYSEEERKLAERALVFGLEAMEADLNM